jgi:hypothetical protein
MIRLACRLALGAPLLAICAFSARPAGACGGCFSPPREVTVVTDHRMAFSVSTQQTVLWDQIKYSGNPSDFSWVLPVRSGTVLQASSDAWFAALDAVTAPTITGPSRPCNGGGAGCGSANGSAAFGDGRGGGVQVVSQGVVGPYDTATLKASDPNALASWLGAHGYALPSTFQPTIAAYVTGGFDFIALRLQPGLGVQAMQPVRVVTQGADMTLPLRMVAAGVGAQVAITLYVVTEGRYEAAPPFANAAIDDSKLFWFHTQNRSNYEELSQSLMAANSGRTWITEYSGPVDLTPSGQSTCGQSGAPSYYYSGQSLADVYLSQCPCPADAAFGPGPTLGVPADASEDTSEDAPDGIAEASSSTAEAAAESSAPPLAPACTGDDVDVALVGLHPSSVWVTRLRANLPAGALAERDLAIQAAATQASVSNLHLASTYDDPSYSPCGNHDGGCAASASASRDPGLFIEGGVLSCVAIAAAFRRVKRRRR